MEDCAKGKLSLLFVVSSLLSSALGVPTLAVDTAVSNYGTTETLKCTDATYSSGASYAWEKDGVTIFADTGEISTTGKYSESIDGRTFKLVINNIDASDEGNYTCSHNFDDSNILDLQVESQGTVTAKLLSTSLVEVTFKQIYPNTISAVITCDTNTVAGSFVSSVADGDRFTSTWQSTNTFATKPTSCSASVTLRTNFSAGITFPTATPPTSDVSSTSTPTTAPTTTTPPSTSTITPSTQIPTSTTSTNSDSSSNSTTTSSAVVPNPATTPSSTVIIISSVVGGLFFVGIVITIVLMLLSQRKKHHPSVKHSRHHRHHDQDRRQKRPYNQEYPTWQDHGRYNNASYMEYTGMGTKMNPLYVPNRSAYRAEQNYTLGHPSADHQSYIRNHHLYYNSNIRPQTRMHSYQQRYYGERGGNNMIRSGLPRDENNYVTPDYELYW